MKKLIFTLTILVMAGFGAINIQGQGYGQGAMQPDGEKLTAYKIAFFTKNLDLTAAEA